MNIYRPDCFGSGLLDSTMPDIADSVESQSWYLPLGSYVSKASVSHNSLSPTSTQLRRSPRHLHIAADTVNGYLDMCTAAEGRDQKETQFRDTNLLEQDSA